MMIELNCLNCNSLYTLGDDYAGKRVRCRKCSHVITVGKPPAEETMPDFNALFTALAEQEREAPTLEV